MIAVLLQSKCRCCNTRRLWSFRIGGMFFDVCPSCDLRARVR